MKMTTRTIPTLAEREAIAKLALGDMDAFVARAAADVGFPFESQALDALARLIEPYERLRARLKAETGVRITVESSGTPVNVWMKVLAEMLLNPKTDPRYAGVSLRLRLRRRASQPRPAKPIGIIAQVDG